jgi:hypothetical protein
MRPRRTKIWMILALSAAMTRSAASVSIAPPPAAVPFSATITGFSQSWIRCINVSKPRRIMLIAVPTTRSGAPSGFAFMGCGTDRSAPVQKCRSPAAVSTIARTATSTCASSKCRINRSRT